MTKSDDEDFWKSTHPMRPEAQFALLAERVKELTKSEKDLIDRVATLEAAYQRGSGVFWAFSFLGTVIGLLIAFGKQIFAPWSK